MKKFSQLLILIVFISSISCQDEIIEGEQTIDCPEMLYFENTEEMFNDLSYIITAGIEEKIEWQEKKGFNSIGVAADKFYDAVDQEAFNSLDEVIQFVNKNSEYLEMVEREGEYYIEPILYDNPFRYFMNEEHIFQIGEKYNKVFSDLRVETNNDNIEKLRLINTTNLNEFVDDKDLTQIYIQDPDLKSASDCYNGVTSEKFSEKIKTGRKWYKTWLKIYPMKFSEDGDTKVAIFLGGGCKVRNIIWWNHKTTLYFTTNSKLGYTKENYGLWSFTATKPYDSDDDGDGLVSSFAKKLDEVASLGNDNFYANPHLLYYDYSVWSDAGIGDDNEGLVNASCQ